MRPSLGHGFIAIVKVYGITNCNTVKSARAWLDARGQRYEFVDYKKAPPSPALLARWCAAFGWESVINRRGTTWRMLDTEVQNGIKDEKSAIALMLAKPSIIKRPIVEAGKTLVLGFDEAEFASKLRS
jgi:Spx/MgsR family transcriptional regulator